jgi:SEC-C motif
MEPAPVTDGPLSLLMSPPAGEDALLELVLRWTGLVGAEARIATSLRLFVITRDPLDWLADRGNAWSTANADGDTLELVVYVTHREVARRLAVGSGDVGATVGPFGEAAVLAAARCEAILFSGAYPELAFIGQAPRLLDRLPAATRRRTPTVSVGSTGWEPIGLGAVQDLVQDAFGPVDLDRSAVALHPLDTPRAGCPACAGERFGFPSDLAEAQPNMCAPHQTEASAITASRIARARASNPAGWRALGKGSARVTGAPEPAGTPLPQRRHAAPGRNDPCPCGSGRKYKRCCGT